MNEKCQKFTVSVLQTQTQARPLSKESRVCLCFDNPIVRQKIEGEVLKCRSLASTITQISDKLNISRVDMNIGR